MIREHEIDIESSTTKKAYSRLTSLCSKMINIVLRTLCPGPGHHMFKKKLLQTIIEGIDRIRIVSFQRTEEEYLTSVIKTLCEWSNKSRKRSVEHHVIRAILNEGFLHKKLKVSEKAMG